MKHLILFALLLTMSFFCTAQDKQQLSVSFDRAPLLSLIEQIEKQTPLKFYFIPSSIDTVRITIAAEQATVVEILKLALDGSGIHFLLVENGVILTAGVEITAHFDSAFFQVDRQGSKIKSTRSLKQTVQPTAARDENSVIAVGRAGVSPKKSFTIAGYVKEKATGEPSPGALVYRKGSTEAVSTNAFGLYAITLPAGRHSLIIERVGMKTLQQTIDVFGDGKLDFLMEESVTQLKEVVVESDMDVNINNVQMGMTKIDVKSMKNIPKILGENDLLKVATTMPGVKSVGEGASGFNVRGGHADQNLVILNEATIYNTSHFLGFFSIFNADAIRSFEVYKSGIPVQHGGRLSSIFELVMRDGNQKKISGQGGIGPITSQLTVEIPLIKDKTSLMAGGRSTYSNWILRSLPKSAVKNTRASFYDFFGRLTHSPNDQNTFYLSFYSSSDNFNLSSDTVFSYTNKLASLQWRHVFNPNFDAVLSATHSEYDYDIDYQTIPVEAFNVGFSINESNVKWDFNHSLGKHKINYGLQAKLYDLSPGSIEKGSEFSLVKPRNVDREKGLESALFLADNIEITSSLSVYLGIRYSMFSALGPKSLYAYSPGEARGNNSIEDTLRYRANDFIKTFHGPEYRLSLRYKLAQESSVKASYNRTRQYVHMLSNTVSVSPTDTWKLSDPNVLPQVADQVSIGYYQDLKEDVFEFSTEIYYKWIQNILDYKTGATLLVNENIEQQILQGNGKAYGVELLLRKKSGKLTGWLGYAYSRTLVQFNSLNPSERINEGKYFAANYDKPHDVNLVTNYKITRRYSFSFNFAYSTGRPITYPIAAYRFGDTYRINYSARNAYRIPDYIRADLGFNIEGNHKIKKLAHSFWSISIYNLLGRKNPYSVYFAIEDEKIKAYKLSIFGAPIPTITYHFRF